MNVEIDVIYLNGTAPGMGSLGVDRGCHTALAEIGQDPVGVAYGDAEPLGKFLGGDIVGQKPSAPPLLC